MEEPEILHDVFFVLLYGGVIMLDIVALAIYAVYCTVIIGIRHSSIAVCWTADAVYSLCIWIQCAIYLRRKKSFGFSQKNNDIRA